jgi:uncharacterized delta-60 repeat protein
VLRRYSADGRIDGSFGTSGQVIVPGGESERAVGVRAIGDKIVIASAVTGGGAPSFRVRRFLASGEPDASFGTRGLAEVPVGAGDQARRMAVLADGSIVVFGSTGNQALLVRVTARGERDTLFGPAGDGTAKVFIGDSGEPASIEVYSSHLVVIGGGNQGGTPGPGTFGVVARLWM